MSRPSVRAMTGLVNAQARQTEADASMLLAKLEADRFADHVAQRDRVTNLLAGAHARQTAAAFEYAVLLASGRDRQMEN